MPDSLPNLRRHFLTWDRPLLPQAVEFLTTDWTRDGPLDLSNTLLVVPTRQSGRRLREALASHAATYSTAVFPPRILLPDSLVTTISDSADIAPRLVSLLVWTAVLRDVTLDEFRQIFPVDPPVRDFDWALRLGQQFTRLQHTLVETGLRLADVMTKAGTDFPEAERWEQIARLEKLHRIRLAELGFTDRHAARIAATESNAADPSRVAEYAGLAGVKRIVLFAAPDPQPLALAVLRAWARILPIDIVVFAPAGECASFDDWGRPLEAAWNERTIEIPDFEDRVHLCADPFSQAQHLMAVLQSYDSPEAIVGLGVADADVLPLVESAFQHTKLLSFNPEGRSRRGDALYQLASALAALAASDGFSNVETLARCPDFIEYLGEISGPHFSAADFLRRLDWLHTQHLPADLAEACRHRPDDPGLKSIVELRASLTSGVFPANAATVLTAIFAARRFDPAKPADAATVEAAAAWSEVMNEIAEAAASFPGVSSTEWWDVALRLYGETIRYDEKPAGGIELQGWLELMWEDAPHLLVAGLNDGRVPEAVVGDPFLPEALRERLGMKTNAARFARDAYVLQAVVNSRASGGRLDLLVGKTSTSGDPLRPSRLLLRCPDEDLPQRVRFLFRAVEATHSIPAWRRAWKLKPRRIPAPNGVAVTALRAWLACPFRFYLSKVLRMTAVEPAKTELDVMDFGTLCHAALEAMGRADQLRDCMDAPTIREFLLRKLEEEASERFGAELTLPLIVQLESARQRLSRAAEVQAATRAEGWVIEKVEEKFELNVGGLLVTGKIDRIDRHEQTGVVRVLDYKTSDQPVEPWQAHLRGVRRNEEPPEFARFVVNGRDHVWSDLQLPLYRRALRTGRIAGIPVEGGNAADLSRLDIVCAYFNLPKAAGDTGLRPWEDYTGELDDAAWRCAEGVADAIRTGSFGPPNENVRADYDDFASLFHHGVAESVTWKEPRAETVQTTFSFGEDLR